MLLLGRSVFVSKGVGSINNSCVNSRAPTQQSPLAMEKAMTLLTVPIELSGDWGKMYPRSVQTVVELMRQNSLDGIRIVSDQQPTRLRIEQTFRAYCYTKMEAAWLGLKAILGKETGVN